MHLNETPIFYDQSGRRWRITENIITVIVMVIGVAGYWLIPMSLANHRPPELTSLTESKLVATTSSEQNETRSVDELMGELADKNIDVIGTGPLVRLIHIEKSTDGLYATDPFTNKPLGSIAPQSDSPPLSNEYALQRYGASKEKRLALTFDDGPDAIYTPRLLDALSEENVPATFFVTGENVAKHPEIVKRLVNEGHSLGNHTFTHIDFDFASNFRGEQEINQTQRLILATSNHDPVFFRPPYAGNTDQSFRNSLRGILSAQKSGYTVASYDFDTTDWHFPASKSPPTYPSFDGNTIVALLHDGGGDRSKTIAYTKELIKKAKESGYSFATLDQLYGVTRINTTHKPTIIDYSSLYIAQAALVWPQHLIIWLFIFSLASLVIISLMNIALAIRNKRTVRYRPRSKHYSPRVSIIVPAYNEDKVIEKSVRSLIRSSYRKIQIIIIDDGSSDQTWKVANSLARRYKRVTALHQENTGKAAALNNAISQTDSEIVICVDADTLFPPETIPNLVRHFEDKTVGAVAGVVKVGNLKNILTKWQSLEYISGISIERNAQALLGAITIVPGACGAWRRNVIMEVGGFSSSTLAEDCDLALKIQRTNRYKILQDNDAISYTEAPQTLMALTKQRFRWTFGSIQSLWKHREMVFNSHYGWLGMYVMPSAIISILVPVIFWPLLIVITVENVLSGNFQVILIFFILSLVVQIIISAIGIALARERYSLLLAVPFARFTYGPIRMYILYKTILTILKGMDVGWNKLARTGTAYEPLGAKLSLAPIQSRKP